jgi:HEAT repeat protein
MSAVRRVERMLANGNAAGLRRVLRRRDALARRHAAQALGELADSASVDALARAIRRDKDQYVRRWAVAALGAIATPEAVGALLTAGLSTRQGVSEAAVQALAGLELPEAAQALELREALLHTKSWEPLRSLDADGRRLLGAALESEQYASWPSARRQRLLEIAVELGVTPPTEYRGELADLGLYHSGVHALSDLLTGLRNPSTQVRTAAAEHLGRSGRSWVAWFLHRRFRRELQSGSPEVAAALGRAMDRLDDPRAIEHAYHQLNETGGRPASDAAYLLAEIGTPLAIDTLFDFAAAPPAPPANRNAALALNALEKAGRAAVDVLRPRLEDESAQIRALAVEVVVRSDHAERIDLLAARATDEDEAVQQAALDALAGLNSPDASAALAGLKGKVPEELLAAGLAAMTHPAAADALREVTPGATTVRGTLAHHGGEPLSGAEVQVVQERFAGASETWEWRAVSARCETDDAGAFCLGLNGLNETGRLRLKVVMPTGPERGNPRVYAADLPAQRGEENHVEAWIDGFFDRLIVELS